MDIKAQIQQTLKDSMFMNGGNAQTEKNFYAFGYMDGAEWMLSQSSELKKENEELKGKLKYCRGHLPECNMSQDWSEAFDAFANTPKQFRDEDYNIALDELQAKRNSCTCGYNNFYNTP